jgi:flagellar motor switch protein FliN/FliY
MTNQPTTPALAEQTSSSLATNPQQWGPMLELPCELSLDLPVPDFTVADLLRLKSGAVLETQWGNGDDVPVRINGQLVAWAEFEILGDRLAVRLTEWA